MNPSNFSDWCANQLHQVNVLLAARDLPVEKPCDFPGCKFWAWRHEPTVRAGQIGAMYECQMGHVDYLASTRS